MRPVGKMRLVHPRVEAHLQSPDPLHTGDTHGDAKPAGSAQLRCRAATVEARRTK